eukprot:2963361-Rhodomonas_salina.3
MVSRIQKDVIAVNQVATICSRVHPSPAVTKGGQSQWRKLEKAEIHCHTQAGASACSPLLENGNQCCRRFLGCNLNCIGLGLASLIRQASSYAGVTVALCIVAYRQMNCRSYGARLRLMASLC